VIRVITTVVSLLLLAACTAQQGFESLKSHEQSRCVKGPAVQYDDCMSRVAMSYEEYTRKFPASEPQPDHSNIAVVKRFVDAFNHQDVSAMLALATHDARWMSVDGDAVSVETQDAGELRTAMDDYFSARINSLSLLLDINANGNFVITFEQAGTVEHRGQCSTAIYEFSGDLIKNVWYYPANDCDGEKPD
jgi:hypothetical protein